MFPPLQYYHVNLAVNQEDSALFLLFFQFISFLCKDVCKPRHCGVDTVVSIFIYVHASIYSGISLIFVDVIEFCSPSVKWMLIWFYQMLVDL